MLSGQTRPITDSDIQAATKTKLTIIRHNDINID